MTKRDMNQYLVIKNNWNRHSEKVLRVIPSHGREEEIRMDIKLREQKLNEQREFNDFYDFLKNSNIR